MTLAFWQSRLFPSHQMKQTTAGAIAGATGGKYESLYN